MEKIDVDQWSTSEKNAYDIQRFLCFLPPIPTVVHQNGLTFVKTREKFRQEQRLLPEEYYGVFDEKSSGPVYLKPPVEIGTKCRAFFKGGSSQHMSTILEGISEIGVNFNDIQFLVASETLHKIAGSVFKQERSWRLRAYSEIIEGRKVIVVCNDDLDEIELIPLRAVRFVKERRESINFAQSLCERYKNRNTNHYLHGNRVVVSSLTHQDNTVNLLVVGETDMAADGHPLNVAVMTGRPNRVCLGDDEEEICDSFEYIWSRCFWIGIRTCIVGMRSTHEDPVKTIHRFDMRDYAQKHRGRIGKYHDTATACVAKVMICLRDQFQSGPNVNWIIEYDGCPEKLEPPADRPPYIRIRLAEESYSLWQTCEESYTAKSDCTKSQREREKRAMDECLTPPTKIIKVEVPATSEDLQLKEEAEKKETEKKEPEKKEPEKKEPEKLKEEAEKETTIAVNLEDEKSKLSSQQTEEQSSDDDLEIWDTTIFYPNMQEVKKSIKTEDPPKEKVSIPKAPRKTKTGIKRGPYKKKSQSSTSAVPKTIPKLAKAKKETKLQTWATRSLKPCKKVVRSLVKPLKTTV